MTDDNHNLPAKPNRDSRGRYLKGHGLGGRPLRLTDDAIEVICDGIAQGRTIQEVCDADENLPAAKTVYQWLSGDRDDEERSARLRKQWDLARERWADGLAHEYIRTVQAAPHDKDEAAWLRELGAAVRWKTAILAPGRYGRRVGDAGDIALNVGVQIVMPDNGRKIDSD